MAAGSQWEQVDLPLLEQVAELEGDDNSRVENQEVLTDVLGPDWDEARIAASISRLVQADYLAAIDASTLAGPHWMRIGLTERGRRAVGLWPGDDAASALLAVLDERIETADSPAERERWRKLRDGAATVGKDVLSGVIVEAVKRGLVF